MPINVVWDEQDPTILRFDITGEGTWVDVHRAIDNAVELMKSQTQRVDVIFHEMTAKAMPPGNPIPNFKIGFAKLTALPNSGIICIVTMQGIPRLAMPFVNIMMRLYRLDMNRIGGNFRSLEEARVCIAQDRAKTAATAATAQAK